MFSRFRADPPARFIATGAALALLPLLALACGLPLNPADLNTSAANPYWACATPTPRPTEEIIVWYTPVPAGSPTPFVIGYTTPVPTATPYYRTGEFYLGQSAVVGELQVQLLSLESARGATLAHFRVTNHASAEIAVPLSLLVFGLDADGYLQAYNPEAQAASGLPSPLPAESMSLPPEGVLDETLAVAGEHAVIGLNTNILSTGAAAARPIWFRGEADPLLCPHGEALWPVPAPLAGGYRYTGPLVPARPDVAAGPGPVESFLDVTTPFGCNPWTGLASPLCQAPEVFHAGLDFSDPAGTPVYTPIGGAVFFAGWSEIGYGNLVVVRAEIGPGDYLFVYFAHLLNDPGYPLLVGEGQAVNCGDAIGYVGSTGHSTGPHLHWETRRGTDPAGPYWASPLHPEDTRIWWSSTCAPSGGEQPEGS